MRQEDRDYLKAIQTGCSARFKAIQDIFLERTDSLSLKLDEVIKHQKEANGKLLVVEQETKMARWVQRKPRAAMFILIGIIIILVVLADVFDIGELLRMYLFKV